MKILALLARLAFAGTVLGPLPLAAQAREPSYPPSPEDAAVSRFAAAAETGIYIDSVTQPLWVSVENSLRTANPGHEDAIATVILDSRRRYREVILDVTPMAARGLPQRIGQTAEIAVLVERALPYAATTAGKELAARVDFDRAYCFVLRRTDANCAPLAAELANLRATSDRNREAYITLLMAVRFASSAAIQMSMDSGNPLALLQKEPVLAAGLAWPE
jgi:hypothetical protein